MLDRTDHNRLAEQFAQRFVTTEQPTSRPTTAVKVATEGVSRMSVFQPAINKSAYLKMGIMGKQGAGKTGH